MKNLVHRARVALVGAGLLFVPSLASAAPNKAACGNVDLLTVQECHFEVSGGCKASCEPLSLQAACDGQCDLAIDAACTADCNGSCVADCEANVAFDCKGSCQADCELQTQTLCNGDASCIQYCQADCNANCDAQCEGQASATCDVQCQAACDASCDVQANFDCSVSCSVDLQGGCEVACDTPDGALFCDGQYVDLTNIDDCVAYLEQQYALNIQVKATVKASASCAMGAPGSTAGAFGAAALLGALALRRRRSR